MALKKIHETAAYADPKDQSTRVVKVHKDSETGEYRARLYIDSKAYEPADYFDSDKQSAIDTADRMVLPTVFNDMPPPPDANEDCGEPAEASTAEVAAFERAQRARPRGYYKTPSGLLSSLLVRHEVVSYPDPIAEEYARTGKLPG